jgi:hypothetical protein
MHNGSDFIQVAEVRISKKRSIVISRFKNDERITIGQKAEFTDEETGQRNIFFYKNPIALSNVEVLEKLRDCLNIAIEELLKNI